MIKNKKKIVSVLLGFIASVSGTKAVMKDGAPSSTKNTSVETVSKSEKRNQKGPGLGRNLTELAFALLGSNEILSNFPVVKKFTYPLFRQMFSRYRVRRGVRGDFIRQNGPNIYNYSYMVFNESDHNFYNINFAFYTAGYEFDEKSGKYSLKKKDTFVEINNDSFKDLKSDKKQSIALLTAFYDIRLVMEDENGVMLSGNGATSVREFLKSDNFTPSDAADALSKVVEFVNIINSNKSDGDKVKLINKNMSAVFCPKGKLLRDKHSIRIFVKERKNAKGETRKIFAEFRMQDEKTKEEIEKEDDEKLKKEMENQNKK